MRRLLTYTCILTLTAALACRDQPVEPQPPGPALAEGGIPGPPPHVVLPDVPPPQAPAPAGTGPPLTNLIAIGAGNDFSCALRSDGAAFCWGANGSAGRLGDGTMASSTVPVAVTGNLMFTQLVVGDLHACGLTATRAAYCWGSNNNGQLGAGLPMPGASSVPVAVVGGLSFNSLSAGLRTTCGIATNGVTYCWGLGGFGQLGNGGFANSNVPVPVTNSLALGFRVVSTGFFSTCATTSLGDVWCWGRDSGQFGNGGATGPGNPTPVAAASGMTLATIDAGSLYNCGLAAGGLALCWGNNNSAGHQGNGTLSPSNSPLPVVGGLSFTSLDAHPHNSILAHTCGIATSGDTYCWGSDWRGELGAPTREDCVFVSIDFDCSTSPRKVLGHRQFTAVAVGIQHTCGVTVAGRAFCWGENVNGQLGDGTVKDKQVPVPVRGP